MREREGERFDGGLNGGEREIADLAAGGGEVEVGECRGFGGGGGGGG